MTNFDRLLSFGEYDFMAVSTIVTYSTLSLNICDKGTPYLLSCHFDLSIVVKMSHVYVRNVRKYLLRTVENRSRLRTMLK